MWKPKCHVVGIGGVTNGGKTTICEKLLKEFPSASVINMDDYFWDEDSPNHTPLPEYNNYPNYDIVSSVDISRLVKDIIQWKNEASKSLQISLLIVEGILIFNHRDLLPFYDKMFFITLDKEECARRREKRTYEPPEPDGYFEGVAWPLYLEYKNQLKDITDIEFIDGAQAPMENYNIILRSIGHIFQ